MESLLREPAFWTIVLFLVPLLLRVPIAVALGSAAIFVVWNWDLGYQMLSYSFFSGIAKFPLLAIPVYYYTIALPVFSVLIFVRIVQAALATIRRNEY